MPVARQGFQDWPEWENLFDIFGVDGSNKGALTRDRDEQPVLLQNAERFANGPTADSKSSLKFSLTQALSALQFALDHCVRQKIRDLLN